MTPMFSFWVETKNKDMGNLKSKNMVYLLSFWFYDIFKKLKRKKRHLSYLTTNFSLQNKNKMIVKYTITNMDFFFENHQNYPTMEVCWQCPFFFQFLF